MTMIDTTSSQCTVTVAGAELTPTVTATLVSVEVDNSLFLPSQFRLVFRAAPDDVLQPANLQLATEVEVSMSTGGRPSTLMKGEVTAVDLDHAPEGAFTTVRGMDRSHRLMHGTATTAYPQMTASDVVQRLVSQADIEVGTIEPTSNVYEWLTQANVSAWVFIQQLAALENCIAYVDTFGNFNFGPMPQPDDGPDPVKSYAESPSGTQLVQGINLIRLRATISAAEQVSDVTVSGYDPSSATSISGDASLQPSSAKSIDPGTLPSQIADEFSAPGFLDASVPFQSEAAASNLAESIASDIAGSMAELEGECIGNPALLAGEVLSIGMVGMPFDGQYVISSARHAFDPGSAGYTTWFTVGGFRDRSLYALASGSGSSNGVRPVMTGLVVGTVSDNNDDADLGRVKVTFPWLSSDYVSAWARTVQTGASKDGAGFLWVPEVGDEVLVGFDRGNIDSPYVVGNLYNGATPPDPAPDIDNGVASRRIVSRTGHSIEFDDGSEQSGLTVRTGSQACTITLDDQQQSITIDAQGQVTIQAGAEGMTLESDGDVSIQAQGSLSLQGMDVSLTGQSDVSVSGTGSVSVSGASISLGG
jgi:phage protein D